MRSSASLVISVSLATALLLSGCSAATESGGEPDETPLTKYFSALYGGDLSEEEQQKKWAEEDKEREELISECMTEEGFEYIPAVQNASFMSSGDEWLPDDREWVAQYGYGMINSPGMDDPAPVDDYVDPNEDYVMSLSESEQQAYYEALSGPPMTAEEMSEEEMSEGGSYEYDWKQAGCYGWAQHEISGEDPLSSDEYQPLFDEIEALYTRLTETPEMADINAKWATCMDDAGFPGFTEQIDAQTSISDEANAMWDASAEEGPDEATMDALADKEVELALADLDCRESTDYRQISLEVQSEIEQQFIDDHKAELDALLADTEQGR